MNAERYNDLHLVDRSRTRPHRVPKSNRSIEADHRQALEHLAHITNAEKPTHSGKGSPSPREETYEGTC